MKQLFQHGNMSKRFLLPAATFFISLAASSQPLFQTSVTDSKTIEVTQSFNEIEIIGDATIILTSYLENQLVFKGDPKIIQGTKTQLKNGKLKINTGRSSNVSNFKVYLPASTIGSLIASGKSKIFSSGTIKNNDLEILINGSSTVSVNHEGKLRVTPGAGYEISNRRD